MVDINAKPRFRRLKPYPEGAYDKKGREVFCDNHPDIRAIWMGEWRPISRIMFYPFSLCGECLIAAKNGDPVTTYARTNNPQ